MQDDERCCGSGTCLINAQGLCWCGQQWDEPQICKPAPLKEEAAQLPKNTVTNAQTSP